MIDYAILCRAIDDWKSGQAPQPLTRPASTSADDNGGYGGVQAPADRTMIYAMPEMADEGGEEEADADAEPEDADAAEMDADADADVDADTEADVEADDTESDVEV